MSDTGNAGQEEVATSGNAGGQESQTRTFTQEDLDRIIARRLPDYDALKSKAQKLDEIENASKTDLERLAGERDKLKGEYAKTQAENLRLTVAISKQLPVELIPRLQGSTKDELEADADELLKLVRPSGTGLVDIGSGVRQSGSDKPTMNDMLRQAAGRS